MEVNFMNFLNQLAGLLSNTAALLGLLTNMALIVLAASLIYNSIKKFAAIGDAYNRDDESRRRNQALLSLIPTGFSLVLLIIGLTVLV
jgi:hypothetical protein